MQMIGKDNPNYIHGFRQRSLSESIRKRDNYTCQICDKHQKDTKLDIHHIDGDHYNNAPSNMISLCRSCHNKVTKGVIECLTQ